MRTNRESQIYGFVHLGCCREILKRLSHSSVRAKEPWTNYPLLEHLRGHQTILLCGIAPLICAHGFGVSLNLCMQMNLS